MKIAFCGNSFVGKTSIVHKMCKNAFFKHGEPTIGAAYVEVCSNNNASLDKLEIWDTSGQERYRAITNIYFRNADLIVIVYDITNRRSFLDATTYWWKIVTKFVSSTQIVLIGNKRDLRCRGDVFKVATSEGEAFATDHQACGFEEWSAKADDMTFLIDRLRALATKAVSGVRKAAPAPYHTYSILVPPPERRRCC